MKRRVAALLAALVVVGSLAVSGRPAEAYGYCPGHTYYRYPYKFVYLKDWVSSGGGYYQFFDKKIYNTQTHFYNHVRVVAHHCYDTVRA